MLVWLTVFSSAGLYRQPLLMHSIKGVWRLVRAHFMAFLIFLSLTYLFSEYKFSRVVLGYFVGLSGAYVLFTRFILQRSLVSGRAPFAQNRKLLIVGTGDTARNFARNLMNRMELGVEFLGFVSETGQLDSDLESEVLGSYSELTTLIGSQRVDTVVIALPRANSSHQDELIKSLEQSIVHVMIVPDIHDYLILGCAVEEFEGYPVLSINDPTIDVPGMLLKRFLDVNVSLLVLVLLLPLFLLIACLVKLTSKGPVFYGQSRMGMDGQTFKMWKFRSMHMDAEAESGPVWAKPVDDRRTQIGSMLRGTSMDELPQLWNILRGEMSLVGPRPERPTFVEKFRQDVPSYVFRHKVKAGLTGWAQVNGWRGDTSLERRIEYDLYYIRNWSFSLDLKILILTLLKGIINKNAY